MYPSYQTQQVLNIARIPYKDPADLQSAPHLGPEATWVPEESDAWQGTVRVEFAIFQHFLAPSLRLKWERKRATRLSLLRAHKNKQVLGGKTRSTQTQKPSLPVISRT
jgi:hypothetical protein